MSNSNTQKPAIEPLSTPPIAPYKLHFLECDPRRRLKLNRKQARKIPPSIAAITGLYIKNEKEATPSQTKMGSREPRMTVTNRTEPDSPGSARSFQTSMWPRVTQCSWVMHA